MKLKVWCDMIDNTRPGDTCRSHRAGKRRAAVQIGIPFWLADLMRRFGVAGVAAVLALFTLSGCALQGGTINSGQPSLPAPVPASAAFDLVWRPCPVTEDYCHGVANALFTITPLTTTDNPRVQRADGDGYAFVTAIPTTWTLVRIGMTADGFVPFTMNVQTADLIKTNADGKHNFYPAVSDHFDPSGIPLETLAAIRSAMWPLGPLGSTPQSAALKDGSTCSVADLQLGPRPGQADNVIATGFMANYSAHQQDCIIAELKTRGYTHVVMGPLVDSDGYHGMWEAHDWRGPAFNTFLDTAQKFWDNGLTPIVFISPDNWTLEQNQAEFSGLLGQPRAQKLLRIIIPHGWEPERYGSCSATWGLYGKWIRDLMPNALVGIHTVSDVDAPVGTDARCDDNDRSWNPGGNAAGWGRVTPFFHFWYTQSGAFDNPTGTGGDREHPELTNFQNWYRQFDPNVRGSYRDRFEHGYAGWPTNSAWGEGKPIRVMCGEYSAYWKFWQHRTEAEGVKWGDACLDAGAYGYGDSGSKPVPVIH